MFVEIQMHGLAMHAWDSLHSDEVERNFKSQNEFIICAINDYYERQLNKKNDPCLETRHIPRCRGS